MANCVKKIAEAIEKESDVGVLFDSIVLCKQKLTPFKMQELVTKLSDYKFSDSKDFFSDGIH